MKKLNKEYEMIVFDLYGTLIDIRTNEKKKEVWEKLALFYGYYGAMYEEEELRTQYFRIVNDMTAGGTDREGESHEAFPEIKIEEVFHRLFYEKGVGVPLHLAVYAGQFFRTLSTEYIRLYPGVKEMLETLCRKGKKLYLLSNAQRIFAEYEMRALDICHYFDRIFISSDYGCKKPDIRFYEKLFSIQGFDRQKAIMIGNDGFCDIEGAKKAGLSTFYVRSNISPKEDTPKADYILEGVDGGEIVRKLHYF